MSSDWDWDIEKALEDRAKEALWNKTELRRITAVHENIRKLGQLSSIYDAQQVNAD